MDDKPMLNSPVEDQSVAGEEFAKTVIGRMDGSHDARAEFNRALAELPEQERERIEKFKQQTFAHFEELTGLTFDRDTGKCTTPGKVRMEGEFKERWTAVCEQMSAEQDPQKGERLWREAGRVLREAVQPDETSTIDGEDRMTDS
jgi:hypothetical protein